MTTESEMGTSDAAPGVPAIELSTVLHDLRNGVTPIIGFAQLLEMDRDQLSPEHAELVDGIVRGAERMIETIDRFRALAKGRPVPPTD